MSGVVSEYLHPLVRWNPGPQRRWIAGRAAVAVALPLIGFTVAGHPQQAFLAGMGVFAVLYGASAPVRRASHCIEAQAAAAAVRLATERRV